jgi:hypothetical protein
LLAVVEVVQVQEAPSMVVVVVQADTEPLQELLAEILLQNLL